MFIGGLDVGTTGCKLTVYSDGGEYIDNIYFEYDVSRVNGEHEADAGVIFEAVCRCIKAMTEKYEELSAIGVTTFGETFVALGENDEILLPAMLYTDPRGEAEVRELCEKLGEDRITYIAGVKPHSMYSIGKIMWIKKNRPEIYAKIKHILLMEDFIVYMLTGSAVIDYSLAARTMALDIRNKCWSDEILGAAGVDKSLLSTPVDAGYCAGEVLEKTGIRKGVKIINGSHDQVATAIGSGVIEPGMAVDGCGTVECLTPVFDKIPEDDALYKNGYCVVPYVFEGTYVCYAFSFTGGATLKWFRDNFAKYEREQQGDNVYAYLDGQIKDEPTGILILPHFAGAATPYMDNGSKAAIVGLTLEHTSYDLYKALMEGVTYELMLNVKHLEAAGINPDTLYATGGGASSSVWLQIKADVLGKKIVALSAKEAGAAGTCMLVAVSMGICSNLHEAKKLFVKEKKTYIPDADKHEKYAKLYEAYKKMYPSVREIL